MVSISDDKLRAGRMKTLHQPKTAAHTGGDHGRFAAHTLEFISWAIKLLGLSETLNIATTPTFLANIDMYLDKQRASISELIYRNTYERRAVRLGGVYAGNTTRRTTATPLYAELAASGFSIRTPLGVDAARAICRPFKPGYAYHWRTAPTAHRNTTPTNMALFVGSRGET